jgi:hypothetical protein
MGKLASLKCTGKIRYDKSGNIAIVKIIDYNAQEGGVGFANQ